MYINSIALEEIQNLAANIIEENIDKNELEEIKKNDRNPLFKAYRVAHTGFSTPTVVGRKKAPILRWFQNAVKRVHDKLTNGIKVFVSHVKDTNSHDGRTAIGRLVGKFTEIKDDMFSSMGILYIEPKFKDVYNSLNLNVGSYEGSHLIKNADSWIVSPGDVGAVSAIALSNSEIDRPAFPKAIEEGELQMFSASLQNFVTDELEKEIANTVEKGEPEKKEEKMEYTISGIQKWIHENDYKPIDIFKKENLKQEFGIEEALKMVHEQKVKPTNIFTTDEMFASMDTKEIIELIKSKEMKPSAVFTEAELEVDEIVDKLKKAANHNSYNQAVRTEGELKEAKILLKEKDSYILKKIEADGVKKKIFDERKFNEKRKTFIDSYFGEFHPSGEKDKLNDEVNKFMDDKLAEYKKHVDTGLIIDSDETEIVIPDTKKNANKLAEKNPKPKPKSKDDDDYEFAKVFKETQGEDS